MTSCRQTRSTGAMLCRTLVLAVLGLGITATSYAQVFRPIRGGQTSASARRTQASRASLATRRVLPRRLSADQAGREQFALVVSVREYPQAHALASLPGTERDALRLASVLRNGGYAEKNVVVVYDDADEALRPTRENILTQLRGLAQRAQQDDSVIVFLTGHGVSLDSISYFCPSDATDAALSNVPRASAELISIKQIAAQLAKQCPAAHKLLVVDACRDAGNDRTANYVQNVADTATPNEGVWIVSSCSNGQFSWMSDRIEKGQRRALFSYYLAEGLEGAADLLGDNDGLVGLAEMYTYAYVKVAKAASEIGQVQTPELFGLASLFTLTTTGSYVAPRKLTTSDPVWEAQRSALQLADDVVLNLRAADAEYRETISSDKASRAAIQDSAQTLQRYLCHLLGNRIEASLEFDEDCRRAHVAQGLCYRTCGMYEEALAGFERGGENFDLFVKAKPGMKKAYIAHDESGGMLRYKDGTPVPRIQSEEARGKAGTVPLVARPGDTEASHAISRESLVRIAKIDGPWMFVSAVNDMEIKPGGWIHRDELHWFPEAVDLYTPSSPMRPWGSGTGGNRLDSAANGLYALSDQLAEPARRIETAATFFDNLGSRLSVGSNIRARLGPLGGFIPYLDYADIPGAYASLPGGWIRTAASYVRIPSNYVAMAGGYAQLPANYVRTAQFWSRAANEYYDGHVRAERMETQRKELHDAGELAPVAKRPLLMTESPWSRKRAHRAKD